MFLLNHKLHRLREFVQSPIYRRVLLGRLLLTLLNRFFPHVHSFRLVDDNGSVHYDTHDRCISLYALAMGNYHSRELKVCLDLMREEHLNNKGTFLEVGANIGSTTIAAARSGAFNRIIAFEPVPKNLDLVHLNEHENTTTTPIKIEALAVSDQEGEATMELSNSNFGDNRLAASSSSENPCLYGEDHWQKTISVKTTSLDHYVKANQLDSTSIALIWLDVQGFEGSVLRGAQNLLAQKKVPICIEFWPYGLKRAQGLEVVTSIIKNTFRFFYRLDSKKRYPVTHIDDLVANLPLANHHYDLLLIP